MCRTITVFLEHTLLPVSLTSSIAYRLHVTRTVPRVLRDASSTQLLSNRHLHCFPTSFQVYKIAYNPAGLMDLAQFAAMLAAAAGGTPLAAMMPAQHTQVVAHNQVNLLTQLLQALHIQQMPAQPVQWANSASQPQPVHQQMIVKHPHGETEREYREARSSRLDDTLVHYLRAARSSRRTRFAILKSMDGCHGYSADWWKNYYLIFTNDIERLFKNGAPMPSLSSAVRKRQPDASSDSDSDVVEVINDPPASRSRTSKRKARNSSPGPSSRPRKVAYRSPSPDSDSISYSDEPRKRAPRVYKLTLPASLPEHAPSAPLNLVPSPKGKGYTFTDEDLAFFVDMVFWQAKTMPDVSRQTILNALSTQATHHSYGSWGIFWDRAKGDKVLRKGQLMAAAAAEE
ncbi:hypothetical protein PENSPDRAFT_657236 [Peniophora sp. CONT]|nr:hypothetical protein PENSPDRAFT_657236 [Peniophora sp. CONT]